MELTRAAGADNEDHPEVAVLTQNALSDLERLILDEAKTCLCPETAVLWQRQVDGINNVQRVVGGSTVALRRTVRGRPAVDEAIAFPNKEPALDVAAVMLVVERGFAPMKALVSSSEGFLSSITYEGSAAYLEQLSRMKQAFDVRLEAQLMTDPGMG